jgi:hypothetical protein
MCTHSRSEKNKNNLAGEKKLSHEEAEKEKVKIMINSEGI